MTRDEIAKQIINDGIKKGLTKDQIKPVLEKALADFETTQPKKNWTDSPITSLLTGGTALKTAKQVGTVARQQATQSPKFDISSILMSPVTNVAKGMETISGLAQGRGLRAPVYSDVANENLQKAVNITLQQAQSEQDPAKRAAALLAVKQGQEGIQKNIDVSQGNLQQEMGLKPNEKPVGIVPGGNLLSEVLGGLGQSAGAVSDVALRAFLAKEGVNAVSGAKNFIQTGIQNRTVNPIAITSKLREQAAQKAGSLNTEGLIKAGDEAVKQNPLAAKTWKTFKPTIGKQMPASELLTKMTDVFGQAFSKTGDVKDKASAYLFSKLYGAGKNIVAQQAPELANLTADIRFWYNAPKIMQKVGSLAAKLGIAKYGLGF